MIEEEEKLIKRLIYEEHNRRKLTAKTRVLSRPKLFRYVGLAASLAILIFAANKFISTGSTNVNELIADVYVFPDFQNTRSAPAKIDNFYKELKQEKYKEVLVSLNQNNELSEKDKFAKAHLLFVLESRTELKNLISNTKFKQTKFQDDIQWLEFLLAYKEKESKSTLESIADNLADQYLNDAEKLLKALN